MTHLGLGLQYFRFLFTCIRNKLNLCLDFIYFRKQSLLVQSVQIEDANFVTSWSSTFNPFRCASERKLTEEKERIDEIVRSQSLSNSNLLLSKSKVQILISSSYIPYPVTIS